MFQRFQCDSVPRVEAILFCRAHGVNRTTVNKISRIGRSKTFHLTSVINNQRARLCWDIKNAETSFLLFLRWDTE